MKSKQSISALMSGFALSCAIFCVSNQVFAGSILDDDEFKSNRAVIQQELQNGRGNLQTANVYLDDQKLKHPEFTYFKVVDATPLQTAAVFTDFYDFEGDALLHGTGLNVSDLMEGPGTTHQRVRFAYDSSSLYNGIPGSADFYIQEFMLRQPVDGAYHVDVKFLKSSAFYVPGEKGATFGSYESMVFEPYGDGKTLVAFTVYLEPKDVFMAKAEPTYSGTEVYPLRVEHLANYTRQLKLNEGKDKGKLERLTQGYSASLRNDQILPQFNYRDSKWIEDVYADNFASGNWVDPDYEKKVHENMAWKSQLKRFFGSN